MCAFVCACTFACAYFYCVCACECGRFVVFLSGVINVVLHWPPCSSCAQLHTLTHTLCKERIRGRQIELTRLGEKHTHTLHCLNYQAEKNENDYWIPRQLQLRQTVISNGHVVQIDYRGEMAMKLKNNSNQRTRGKKKREKKPKQKESPLKGRKRKGDEGGRDEWANKWVN